MISLKNRARRASAFLLFTACAFGGQYSLVLTPANTKIAWTLGDVLHTVHGTFQLKSGTIDFDPATDKASGRIVVSVTTGDSGNGARDRRMQSSVLESEKYPEAVFTPDRIEGKLEVPGTSAVKIHGTFTIHGTAHDLTMDAKTQATADGIKADLTFAIPYVAWGMKDPSNFVLKVNKSVEMSVETTGALTKR